MATPDRIIRLDLTALEQWAARLRVASRRCGIFLGLSLGSLLCALLLRDVALALAAVPSAAGALVWGVLWWRAWRARSWRRTGL